MLDVYAALNVAWGEVAPKAGYEIGVRDEQRGERDAVRFTPNDACLGLTSSVSKRTNRSAAEPQRDRPPFMEGEKMMKRTYAIAGLLLGATSCTVDSNEGADLGSDEGATASVEQPIWYGDSSAANLAVVELYRNGGSYCTGFFISRRHIVTAAHCTDNTYGSQYYRVRIKTGYGSFTSLSDSASPAGWVLMTEHTAPAWTFSNASAVGDAAILTLPSTAWSSVPVSQQLLRVATSAPVNGEALSIWGWGRRVATDPAPAGDLLSGNAGSQISVAGSTGSGTGRWFWAYATNNARTCDGDSGGPATRYVGGYYVALGDHGGPPAGYTQRCAEYGIRMDWASLHDKTAWIESVLRSSYGSTFSCARFGSGTGAYMRCF